MPGAVLVALATISPAGVLPKWQVSQVVDDGMCEFAPTGEVGGNTTMLVMPVNELPVIVGPWQATQLLVMPVWLNLEPENFAPSTTGVAAMLEPVPTWHDSQAPPDGTWLVGCPTIVKFAAGIANEAAAAPWHCAQLLVVLSALAWMLVSVGSVAKLLVVWQAEHCAVAAYGM